MSGFRFVAERVAAIGLAALALTFSPVRANAGPVTFLDQTFDPAGWTTVPFPFGDGGQGTVAQVATSGNPGPYRSILLDIQPSPSASTFSALWLFNFHQSAIYDPSSQGAIATIDYAEDSIFLGGVNDVGTRLTVANGTHAVSLALRQNGVLYIPSGFALPGASWGTFSLAGLTETNFSAVGAPGHLDFSTSGALVQFGFLHRVSGSIGGIGFESTTGIDNWTVTVTPVPEPSTLLLVVGGAVGIAVWRRRREG